MNNQHTSLWNNRFLNAALHNTLRMQPLNKKISQHNFLFIYELFHA